MGAARPTRQFCSEKQCEIDSFIRECFNFIRSPRLKACQRAARRTTRSGRSRRGMERAGMPGPRPHELRVRGSKGAIGLCSARPTATRYAAKIRLQAERQPRLEWARRNLLANGERQVASGAVRAHTDMQTGRKSQAAERLPRLEALFLASERQHPTQAERRADRQTARQTSHISGSVSLGLWCCSFGSRCWPSVAWPGVEGRTARSIRRSCRLS